MSTETIKSLGEREKQVLWVSGYYREQGTKPGSFYMLLIQAFFAADLHNKARLKQAFPITGRAFENYMSGELKEKYNLPDD